MNRVCERFSYVTVGEVVLSIVEGNCSLITLVPGTLDLTSAYRSVPICAQNRQWYLFGHGIRPKKSPNEIPCDILVR